MAYKTCIHQGYFTSDGYDEIIPIRAGVDWVKVVNLTNIAGATQWAGTEWYWQRGMTDRDAVLNYHGAASQLTYTSTCAIGYNGAVYEGITPLDSSENPVGALDATVTAVSGTAIPVVTCTSTADLKPGDIVRMINVTGAQQLGGIDFVIGVASFTATTFNLEYMTQIVAGTGGYFRKIDYDPLFYPRKRFITSIEQAVEPSIIFTVQHGYAVGQKVRFTIPAAYGMTELDGLQATIIDKDEAVNSITIDIDTSGFSAFAFPLTAAVPFSPAIMTPVGQAVETLPYVPGIPTVSPFEGAVYNTGYTGFKLGAGSSAALRLGSAAGTAGDAIKWIAGKSFDL